MKDISFGEEMDVLPGRRRYAKMLSAAGLAVVLLLVLTFALPVTAYAEDPEYHWITDFGGSLNKFVCSLCIGAACWCLNIFNSVIGSIADSSLLTESFDSLLGVEAYNMMQSVYEVAVVPVAESILALFMLVQLVKISQRIDATATLPAVKDIVFLFVVYVLLHWFIVNALDVMQAVYGLVVDSIIPAISGSPGGVSMFEGEFSTDPITQADWDAMEWGSAFVVLITSFLCMLISYVVYIIAIVVAYARAWQIYIYAAFSGIPVALLGFDETRQMGIGFLRNFAAICLAGAIMVFILAIYPYVLTSTVFMGGGSANIVDFVLNVDFTVMLRWLAASIMVGFALVKSGAWAREILGG